MNLLIAERQNWKLRQIYKQAQAKSRRKVTSLLSTGFRFCEDFFVFLLTAKLNKIFPHIIFANLLERITLQFQTPQTKVVYEISEILPLLCRALDYNGQLLAILFIKIVPVSFTLFRPQRETIETKRNSTYYTAPYTFTLIIYKL